MIKTGALPIICMVCGLCALCILSAPVHAFTSDSLDITIDKNGDAVANFQFTLEGIIENSIPQSMLETELKKGLTTSSDPPVVLSFDRTGASLMLKNFAVKNDVPTGTEYATASMDFKKAELALKNSALSYVVSADFSPKRLTVRFPDGYTSEFLDSSVLPSLKHTVIDASKTVAVGNASPTGAISVNSTPPHVRVYIDTAYVGNSPSTFSGISPGQHEILCEMDGFLPFTKIINVTAGQTTTVNAVLSYITPTPTKSAPGFEGLCACLAVIWCGIAFWRRK